MMLKMLKAVLKILNEEDKNPDHAKIRVECAKSILQEIISDLEGKPKKSDYQEVNELDEEANQARSELL